MSHITAQPEPRISVKSVARDAFRAMNELDATITLDPALRELVKTRASQLNGCAYCIDLHTRDAQAAGESERRLFGVFAWHESPFFSERERAALALTDAITLVANGGVPDEVYDEAARLFDEDELAQLILAITVINMWNRIAVTGRSLPEDVRRERQAAAS